MIQFDVISIFPEILSSYINESLIARAREKKLIKIHIHNLRKWAKGPHKQVDHRPFGGGLGMVMMIEPIYKAIKKLKKKKKAKVILFTPRGKKFTQVMAFKLAKEEQLIFICGRYEGVDERVAKEIADIELSIGDYDLMGGELPAMIVIEAVSRLIPGVLGKPALLKERVTKSGGFLEYAQYTRPEVYEMDGKKLKVPKVLLSGDHKKVDEWKRAHGKVIEQ
jgi:tRNA (guanine37-N1)-methyltransferase